MHPRFRFIFSILPLLALVLSPLAACSPGKEAEPPAPAAESGRADAGIDLDAVLKKAQGETENIRLTMAAARETKIEVLSAEPSPVPGLVDLKIRVTRQGRTAVRRLPVTPDLKMAVAGVILPLGKIPRVRVELENVNFADVPSRGNPNAEVTIVEYSDFQCPFCRASQAMIDRILREYDGRVRLVYKHYPLKIHEWAMDGSLLAECARAQKPELFWKLHDYYYANSTELSRENLFEKTQEQVKGDGVDMNAFNKCYLEQKPLDAIRASIDEGKTIGVRGTPAFLINDVFASGAVPYEIINAIVLEELGEKSGGGA